MLSSSQHIQVPSRSPNHKHTYVNCVHACLPHWWCPNSCCTTHLQFYNLGTHYTTLNLFNICKRQLEFPITDWFQQIFHWRLKHWGSHTDEGSGTKGSVEPTKANWTQWVPQFKGDANVRVGGGNTSIWFLLTANGRRRSNKKKRWRRRWRRRRIDFYCYVLCPTLSFALAAGNMCLQLGQWTFCASQS